MPATLGMATLVMHPQKTKHKKSQKCRPPSFEILGIQSWTRCVRPTPFQSAERRRTDRHADKQTHKQIDKHIYL